MQYNCIYNRIFNKSMLEIQHRQIMVVNEFCMNAMQGYYR